MMKIKNQSKINQKWIKNRSKIARNRGLEASWRRLGASWRFGAPLHLWYTCGTGVEAQRAPIRILHDFHDIIRNIIRNIRNDMRKEIRIMILLGYGTLYAMRRPKAWRGGSKAPLRGVPAIALDS